MAQVTVELPDDKVAFFKKVVEQFGFIFKTGAKASKAAATPAKKPRTKVEQDFVDGYREMVEAENGTGPPLRDFDEVLKEFKEEQAKYWGNGIQS